MSGEGSLAGEARDTEERITIGVLRAVEADSSVSQRSMAAGLNIALGLTNAYLKRCIHKGWVKVQKVPANRYAYYLTPRGFSEKSRLTASYLARSFQFYRRARNQVDGLFEQARANGIQRIAVAGSGELAEVALLCALQFEIEIVGVCDPEADANRFRHVPLVRDLGSLNPVDAVLLTEMKRPDLVVAHLGRTYPSLPLLVPPLLGVTAEPEAGDEQGRAP